MLLVHRISLRSDCDLIGLDSAPTSPFHCEFDFNTIMDPKPTSSLSGDVQNDHNPNFIGDRTLSESFWTYPFMQMAEYPNNQLHEDNDNNRNHISASSATTNNKPIFTTNGGGTNAIDFLLFSPKSALFGSDNTAVVEIFSEPVDHTTRETNSGSRNSLTPSGGVTISSK